MSTISTHVLSWENRSITEDQVVRALEPMLSGQRQQQERNLDETRRIITGSQTASWDRQDRDLCQLSLMWPGTLFTADRIGEDGERWRTFYRDGAFYSMEARPPEFSELAFLLLAKREEDK